MEILHPPPYIPPSSWGYRISQLPSHTWTSQVRQVGNEFHLNRFVFQDAVYAKGFAWYIKAMTISGMPLEVVNDYVFRSDVDDYLMSCYRYQGDVQYWEEWKKTTTTPKEFIAFIRKNNIYDELGSPEATRMLPSSSAKKMIHIMPYEWSLRISPRKYTTRITERRNGKEYDYRGLTSDTKMQLVHLQTYVQQAQKAGINLVPYFWELYHATDHPSAKNRGEDFVAWAKLVMENGEHNEHFKKCYLPARYFHPSEWNLSWDESLQNPELYTNNTVKRLDNKRFAFLAFVSHSEELLQDFKTYLLKVYRADPDLCRDYLRVVRSYSEERSQKKQNQTKGKGNVHASIVSQKRKASSSPPSTMGMERIPQCQNSGSTAASSLSSSQPVYLLPSPKNLSTRDTFTRPAGVMKVSDQKKQSHKQRLDREGATDPLELSRKLKVAASTQNKNRNHAAAELYEISP